MSSFYGIGTNYLGWKVGEDGVPTATEWFVVFYLPIVPIGRKRLYVVSLEDSVGGIPGINGTFTLSGKYRILEDLPIKFSEVLWTYFFGYVLVPLILMVPLLVIVPYFQWYDSQDKLKVTLVQDLTAIMLIVIFPMVYVGVILATLLHRTRGIGMEEYGVKDSKEDDDCDEVEWLN